MDSSFTIHQAAVKALSRLEYTITEGHLSQPSYVLHRQPSARDEGSMRHSKAILGTTEDQHALIMSPLFYIVPLEARASSFHFHLPIAVFPEATW